MSIRKQIQDLHNSQFVKAGSLHRSLSASLSYGADKESNAGMRLLAYDFIQDLPKSQLDLISDISDVFGCSLVKVANQIINNNKINLI